MDPPGSTRARLPIAMPGRDARHSRLSPLTSTSLDASGLGRAHYCISPFFFFFLFPTSRVSFTYDTGRLNAAGAGFQLIQLCVRHVWFTVPAIHQSPPGPSGLPIAMLGAHRASILTI